MGQGHLSVGTAPPVEPQHLLWNHSSMAAAQKREEQEQHRAQQEGQHAYESRTPEVQLVGATPHQSNPEGLQALWEQEGWHQAPCCWLRNWGCAMANLSYFEGCAIPAQCSQTIAGKSGRAMVTRWYCTNYTNYQYQNNCHRSIDRAVWKRMV